MLVYQVSYFGIEKILVNVLLNNCGGRSDDGNSSSTLCGNEVVVGDYDDDGNGDDYDGDGSDIICHYCGQDSDDGGNCDDHGDDDCIEDGGGSDSGSEDYIGNSDDGDVVGSDDGCNSDGDVIGCDSDDGDVIGGGSDNGDRGGNFNHKSCIALRLSCGYKPSKRKDIIYLTIQNTCSILIALGYTTFINYLVKMMFILYSNLTKYFIGGKLIPDFFLDEHTPDVKRAIKDQKFEDMKQQSTNTTSSADNNGDVEGLFSTIKSLCNEDLVKSTGGVFEFRLGDGSTWYLDLKNGAGLSALSKNQ